MDGEARWSCGGAGGVEARWSCGSAVELRWHAATPGLAAAAAGGEEGAVDWGIEVPGLGFCGQWTMLYIGAAEMAWARWMAEVAQGRGW